MAKHAKKNRSLHFLYETVVGRICLKALCTRWVSKMGGWYMDTRLSKPLIKKFVENNEIDLSQFESDSFRCFNDCFSRKIKSDLRPIMGDETALVSPCDGLLSAYRIQKDMVIPVKQSEYTLASLLQNEELAEKFENGTCLVFRLCVHHYHRYCYPIGGIKSGNIYIPGKLHTVRPIALENRPVFAQNSREFTLINSPIGAVLQMEVGAMLVGKILNHHEAQAITKGEEKGMFLYGGSTVILLLEKDGPSINQTFFENTENQIETPVVMGQLLA